MFQLELVRQITFWCLFVVSAFLSVNLYVGLVDGIYNQGFMVIVAVVLEGIKILTLTMANTARWQVAQHKLNHMKETMLGHFSRLKRKLVRDPEVLRDVLDASRKQRRAIYLYGAYLLTAFLSISASFGYVRVTVENATTQTLTVDNSSTIAVYQDSMKQYDAQIKENQAIIAQAQQSISQYNAMIQQLDPLSDTFSKDRATYQGNINAYQKIIDQKQQKNSDLQDQKLALSDKIQNYKVQDVQVVKATHKTMYQLMGEVLGMSDKTIMYILLNLLAFILEVGLFICSPHFHKMDDDDKPTVTFKSVKEETLEKERHQKTAPKERGVEQPSTEKPPIGRSGDEPAPETGSKKDGGGATEVPAPAPEGKLIQIPSNAEALAETPATTIVETEDIPERVIEPIEFRFIEALFNNNGKRNLKDKTVAAAEVGMKKYDAVRLFDYLNRSKEGIYPWIEYREDKLWYPNVTSQLIKQRLTESNFAWRNTK